MMLDYETHHPGVADIFWLVEVSDSTLAYDCGEKALAYARAGIQD
jgi:Putative restriction endonuclease